MTHLTNVLWSAHKNVITIGLKENISVKDVLTTASSKILNNYKPPYNATIVKLLSQSNIVDKNFLPCAMDEFAMGSLGIYNNNDTDSKCNDSGINDGAAKILPNPWDESRVIGGSSCGSAYHVAKGNVDVSIGTDTGGSVRLPAAWCSLLGFKPTYGRISRFGIIDFAQSLDTVGLMANDIDKLITIFQIVDKYDKRDITSTPVEFRDNWQDIVPSTERKFKFGIPIESKLNMMNSTMKEVFLKFVDKLLYAGHQILPVSIPTIKYCIPIYYTIATSEAVSNLSRYDGIRYGARLPNVNANEQNSTWFDNTRSLFGSEVKKRLVLGNYNLCSNDDETNNYNKAMQLRSILIDEFNKIFKLGNPMFHHSGNTNGIDFMLCPTSIDLPPLIKDGEIYSMDPIKVYSNDALTIPMSLTGLPTMTIPISDDRKTPFGIQITSQFNHDYQLLSMVKNNIYES